jgi:predicted dehydrogenase
MQYIMDPILSDSAPTRRTFLKTTAAVSAAAVTLTRLSPAAYAQGVDKIRVGIVGCGGRGSGAVRDCTKASPSVQIVAMGDVFQDRLDGAARAFSEPGKGIGEQFACPPEKRYVGFDAYQKVLADPDVDMVILATPPGFRPTHIKAAIEAGKHVFAEKPCAVDGPGIRKVLEAAEAAKQKNLAFVAGTQRRHQQAYIDTISRIKDGAIGEIVAGYCYWNQGSLWMHARKPEWSDMEWQLRNWLYFTWLSGDHIVEQHVHNIDVMNWVIGEHPKSAYCLGGRQVRTDPAYGHIFDHFATEFEYPSGARVTSMCRQIDDCDNRINEFAIGTAGKAEPGGKIMGTNAFKYKKSEDEISPYVQEHIDLIASIKAGKPLNEARQVAESTLSAIMARMSAYSGKVVTWEQALNSNETHMPETLAFGPLAVPPVAMPGKTKLA